MTPPPAPPAPRSGARLAPAALALATLAVSFSGIFIRLARGDPATVVWVRMAMTVALLAPLALRDARRGAIPTTPRQWLILVAGGSLLAVHFLTWTASLQYTSVASSVLLVSLHPVFVAAAGRRLLGEAVPPRMAAGIGVALAGTAVTTVGDVRISTAALGGDLLALAGALSFTGYLLIGRSVRAQCGAAAYSVTAYGVVAVIAAALAAGTAARPLPTARTALACLGLALVCTAGGHTVFNWTLRHLRAAVVSVALLAEPPITTLLAIPLLSQTPPLTAVLGGAVILAGLALAVTARTVTPADAVTLVTAE